MKYALWEDRTSTKKSIGTSPFDLLYGTNVVFPTSLGVPVMKILIGARWQTKLYAKKIQSIDSSVANEGKCLSHIIDILGKNEKGLW